MIMGMLHSTVAFDNHPTNHDAEDRASNVRQGGRRRPTVKAMGYGLMLGQLLQHKFIIPYSIITIR